MSLDVPGGASSQEVVSYLRDAIATVRHENSYEGSWLDGAPDFRLAVRPLKAPPRRRKAKR